MLESFRQQIKLSTTTDIASSLQLSLAVQKLIFRILQNSMNLLSALHRKSVPFVVTIDDNEERGELMAHSEAAVPLT